MKAKRILLIVLLILTLTLSACDVEFDVTAKAEPFIKEMLAALAAEDLDSAAALLHPDRVDDATDAALAEIAQLLDGREVTQCVVTGLNVGAKASTKGTSRTESGSVRVLFADGSDLELQYFYVSDNSGEGFSAFRFLVGV